MLLIKLSFTLCKYVPSTMYQKSALSRTNAYFSLVNFQTAYIMRSKLGRRIRKNPNLYHCLHKTTKLRVPWQAFVPCAFESSGINWLLYLAYGNWLKLNESSFDRQNLVNTKITIFDVNPSKCITKSRYNSACWKNLWCNIFRWLTPDFMTVQGNWKCCCRGRRASGKWASA